MAKLVDAHEQLLEQYSTRTRWMDKMKPMSKEQEEVRQQVLTSMALPVANVSKLLGMNPVQPFLLNISDDPALSGCLLYFLKHDGRTTIGSGAGNDIRLEGLGICDELCALDGANGRVRMSKRSVTAGRVSVNGTPLGDASHALNHGDRLVFGRAFVFRLLLHGEDEAIRRCSEVVDSQADFRAALNESIAGSRDGEVPRAPRGDARHLPRAVPEAEGAPDAADRVAVEAPRPVEGLGPGLAARGRR